MTLVAATNDPRVSTAADGVARVAAARPHKPMARKLVRLLAQKKNVLVSCHKYPDPDALGSAIGTVRLLEHALQADAKITLSVKGAVASATNAAFLKLARFNFTLWDDAALGDYDAIVLVDVQPQFPYSPLPASVTATAVIDHHRARGRKPKGPLFCDIRTDVGACASIVFSYLAELAVPIDPLLAATLLYAIESDLSGAAGVPDDLDNLAISALLLKADPRVLYAMRHSPLPRAYYAAFHKGIGDGQQLGPLLLTHLGAVETPETPALVADFLLRFDESEWVMVTAVHDGRLTVSLRTGSPRQSAGDLMRRVMHNLGNGGGHRTKAGGFVPLKSTKLADVDAARLKLRRRLACEFGLPRDVRPQRLVAPKPAAVAPTSPPPGKVPPPEPRPDDAPAAPPLAAAGADVP